MTSPAEDQLDHYRRPARMTAVGGHTPALAGLPREPGALARVLHGLVIHEHIAPAYGVELTREQRASVHVRPAEQLLDLIVAADDRPLTEARDPRRRLPGNCRHFTVLLAAILRAQGVPARARCGFGGYFNTGAFEDHWVCEYWDARRGRWVLADAQIDEVQRGFFDIDFDLMDVPRDRFLVAGDAWAKCRSGAADPGRFGLSLAKEAGSWWIAGNLMRDVAALRNVELLPWDAWGAMPKPADEIDDASNALFDELASFTAAPDEKAAELRDAFDHDERIAVHTTVFNVILGREEEV